MEAEEKLRKRVYGNRAFHFLIDKEGRVIKEWRKVKVKDHVAEALQTLKDMSEK